MHPASLLLSPAGGASAAKNLALLVKASASSIWQDSLDMVPAKAIDGDMKTRWGGKARGEWYQLEWDTPHALCGAVIYNYNEVWNKNIPFTLQVWDPSSNGQSGDRYIPQPDQHAAHEGHRRSANAGAL